MSTASSVSFDGKNYIDYERYVRNKYGTLNKLQQAHMQALKESDKLCVTCNGLPNDRRMCAGTRRYFDEAESASSGVERIVMQGCHKLEVLNDIRATEVRFDNSLLFRPVINFLKEQREDMNSRVALPVAQSGMSYKIGTFELPVCSWAPDDGKQYHREVLMEYAAAMIYAEKKVVYLRSNDYYSACLKQMEKNPDASKFYQSMKWAEDIYPLLMEADWVILVNLHGVCPITRFKGILFDVVKARYDSAKPTTLVLNQPFNVQNETEKSLMELVESWQQLSL